MGNQSRFFILSVNNNTVQRPLIVRLVLIIRLQVAILDPITRPELITSRAIGDGYGQVAIRKVLFCELDPNYRVTNRRVDLLDKGVCLAAHPAGTHRS
jgi:hypothetical protein